ncbi:hypothetical protein PAMC26577_33445 [Caballeronia sordidicola]|uniref:Uncharacterized protein n=1 Tax=Caballeronia sordidicola TaxID=196367 RepID=A0A242MBK2_CABSO|nr:hypothetical protein PAMC26577_33445 [Caballeronia sordidicola]
MHWSTVLLNQSPDNVIKRVGRREQPIERDANGDRDAFA